MEKRLVWQSGGRGRNVFWALALPFVLLFFAIMAIGGISNGGEYYLMAGFFGIVTVVGVYGYLMETVPSAIAYVRSRPFIEFREDGFRHGWRTYRWDGIENVGTMPDEPFVLLFLNASNSVRTKIDLEEGANVDCSGAVQVILDILGERRRKAREAGSDSGGPFDDVSGSGDRRRLLASGTGAADRNPLDDLDGRF